MSQVEVYYGLPRQVEFCSRCVISNQRPNSAIEFKHTGETKKETINFVDGVCDACRYAEKKKEIDWDSREHQLRELCDRFRKADGSYDCLVPGSGGKDSFYAAHKLKYEYGMNPLTVTWAPHIYTDWGWANFQSWIHSGFDNYLCTPNGRTHRLLTRLAVENLLHPFQPFMIGQKALAPKLAAKHGISLIFYGEDEAEYGNPIEDTESSQRAWHYFASSDNADIYLGGVSLAELTNRYLLSMSDLDLYLPADPRELEANKTEVHYLGYYLKWHPQGCYYYAQEHSDFKAAPERTVGTYSTYNSIDDKIDDLHYYTTGVKFGLGRASYDASQEIRSGDITRFEGVRLVEKYDHEYPSRFLPELLAYLSIDHKTFGGISGNFEEPVMTKDYFDDLVDSFRSPHLWLKKHGSWSLVRSVYA